MHTDTDMLLKFLLETYPFGHITAFIWMLFLMSVSLLVTGRFVKLHNFSFRYFIAYIRTFYLISVFLRAYIKWTCLPYCTESILSTCNRTFFSFGRTTACNNTFYQLQCFPGIYLHDVFTLLRYSFI